MLAQVDSNISMHKMYIFQTHIPFFAMKVYFAQL